MSMQQLPVVSRIPPSVLFGQDVIDFHLVPIREVQTACSTLHLLLLQEPSDSRGYAWMVSYSFAPVDTVSVVATTWALDFHMSLHGGVCMPGEACSAGARFERTWF